MQVEGASVDSADALLEKVNIIVRCATPQFNAGLLSATATELLCSGNWLLLDEIINTTTTAAATTSPQKEQQKAKTPTKSNTAATKSRVLPELKQNLLTTPVLELLQPH
jgi:hypothetical protein